MIQLSNSKFYEFNLFGLIINQIFIFRLKKEILNEPETFKERVISGISSTIKKPGAFMNNIASNMPSVFKKK